MKQKSMLLLLLLLICIAGMVLVGCALVNTEDPEETEAFVFVDSFSGDGVGLSHINRDVLSDADIVIPDTDSRGRPVVAIYSQAFENDTTLKSVKIPETVAVIGEKAFYGCSSLESVNFPNALTEIRENAFFGCKSLKSLEFPASLTIIGNPNQTGTSTFASCTALESITVAEGNESYYSQDNCLIRKRDKCLMLGCKNSIIPTDGSVEWIGGYAFSGSAIETVTIPSAITCLATSAFSGCTSLTSVTLPGSLTEIPYASFYGCTELTEITIPASVEKIGGWAFAECPKLTDVYYEIDKGRFDYIFGSRVFENTNCTIHFANGDVVPE